MKFNKQTLRFAACMAGIFAFLAVCARVTDSAVPTSAEASERPVIVPFRAHRRYAETGCKVRRSAVLHVLERT